MTTAKRPHRMPGDASKTQMLDSMIRVDHAGEYGAVRIYEGQLAVLGRTAAHADIEHMAEQERVHLQKFNDLIRANRVRPTALLPLWHVAGFALGAGTALLGEKAAHACTVAVEEVIDEHYAEQVAALDLEADQGELRDTFEAFRLEELEHRDTALEHGAEQAPGYAVLKATVKTGSRLAIWLSKKI
ncbi:MAG: demethoxyubiquinone hydroxylase family protein [Rhodospirillales bacterium]